MTESLVGRDTVTSPRSRARPALVAGDIAALALFAPLGLVSHDEGITAAALARNAGPVVVGWLAASMLLQTYAVAGGTARGRTVATWAVGVTAGVVVRGFLLGRSLGESQVTFLLVTLSVTGVLLAAWRLLWVRLSRRPAGSEQRRPSRPKRGRTRGLDQDSGMTGSKT
jgi:hypothetical protein